MSTFFPREIVEQAGRDAAWIARHGTREERSGRFLPPEGWREPEVPAPSTPARLRRAPR